MFFWYSMSSQLSWNIKKKKHCFFFLFFSPYLFPRSVQSKHIPEEWLGSCLYFQNADYCADPTGLVFFSEHFGDVSPKVAPWCRDPWPSVGDPTRCGVCAGTVARGSSVSRGEALSPQTATESMARGVLSAPLSIILPPCLSLSLFLSHFSFLSLSFTLFPFATVSHFAFFSVIPCSTLCFCFSLTFFSRRYPHFHSGTQSHTVPQLPPPLPSHIHTLTFLVWLFLAFFHSLICFTLAFLQS